MYIHATKKVRISNQASSHSSDKRTLFVKWAELGLSSKIMKMMWASEIQILNEDMIVAVVLAI